MTQTNNGEIIRAKGKRGGQPGNRNAFKHGYRGLRAPEPLVREGYAPIKWQRINNDTDK